MELFIGVDKDNELVSLEWDKENNRERKSFSLCGSSYDNPITDSEGEKNARETLSSSDYWDDLGMIDNKSFLMDFINFDEVAEHVLSNDGWFMTNGEYDLFGEIDGEDIYLNASSGGQHQVKIIDFNRLFVDKEDLKKVYDLWDNQHLKPLREKDFKFMCEFFEKYKNLCDRQEALNLYYKILTK